MATQAMQTLDVTVYDAAAVMPIMDRSAAKVRYQAMVDFVGDIMREGLDFGKVPGTGDKPTLLKPGAEKLTTFFGLSKRFVLVEKVEDWTGKDHGGEAFFYYLYRCQLYKGDLLIAECDGSANSWESKYRYRKAERVCPQCGQATIIKGKKEYGGGWLCFAKKGGCGAKFADGDKAIEAQEVGRIVNPDPADIVNTLQKMSQKRALVGSTLLAVNGSDYFTQDVEDYIEGDYSVTAHKPQSARVVTTEQPKPAPATNGKQAQDPPGFDVWADWTHVDHAIAWGLSQGVFDHENHTRNAYAKCKTACKPIDHRAMWQCWYQDVQRRIADKAAPEAATDFDAVDTSEEPLFN